MSTRHPSNEDHFEPQAERQRREELYKSIVSQPYRFVGTDRPNDDADPAIKPLTGELCILVPRDSPPRFWEDERLQLGVCNFYPKPNNGDLEEACCPFKAVSVLAAPTVAHLYAGAFIQMHRSYPDMSRPAIIRDLRERWKPIRVELNAVRVGNLTQDPDLIGGEPGLRWSGNQLQFEQHAKEAGWTRVRQTLERFAAADVVGADPGWQHSAFRFVIWITPFGALVEQQIVRLHPEHTRTGVMTLLLLRDRTKRPVAPQLLGQSPERRGRLTRATWRSARTSRRALRWIAGVARDEGGWRDPDLDSRARKRDILFATIRRLATLIAAPIVLVRSPILQLINSVFEWLHKALL